MLPIPRLLCLLLLALLFAGVGSAQRQMEYLERGLVAIHQGGGKVYLSWRLLGTDPDDVAFNVYRSTGGGTATKLNSTPITSTTDFVDTTADTTAALAYTVRPLLQGTEQAVSRSVSLPAGAPVRAYLSFALTPPAGGTTPDNVAYTYVANDCSAGDLDGDGEYDLVLKWDPTNSKDNSQSGYTGNVYLDGYKLDGTRLWRIDLGRNIRAGAHYTQFIVYDLDGDGRAEVACKTADATVDGQGTVIGNAAADYRNTGGYILTGREYLTVFDGLTGAALSTTDYVPARNNDPSVPPAKAEWGDDYGNRVDRFLAAVAYVDGTRPSLVMCRGYYTRAVVTAWNWRNGSLTRAWTFDSNDGTPGNSDYRGQGNHNLSVADVDNDGRDEIIYGSCAIDDDGKALHLTRLGHGDALHVSDLDPERPGLEAWQCHEDYAGNGGVGLSFREAATGNVLWTVPSTRDAGRALSADIDPAHPGAECWGAVGGLYSAKGVQIGTSRPGMNFAVWWDGDDLREMLDGNRISKWNPATNSSSVLLEATGCTSNNGTKSTPALSADLFGDWREEVVWRSDDNRELRIYTTTTPATRRIYTLMHDPQYRAAIAWQNTAYNQPPHPSFFIGQGMKRPPTPLIRTVNAAGSSGSSQLTNMSVLTWAGEGDASLIVGFSVQGTGNRPFLVRGIGPTLELFSYTTQIRDPKLTLVSEGVTLATNDNWADDGQGDAIMLYGNSVGAFTPARDSRDAMFLRQLGEKSYSAVVSAASGTGGHALVELYTDEATTQPRLNNLSVRADFRPSDGPLMVGFNISGSRSRTILFRAVGPRLASLFGMGGVLADPTLTLYRNGTSTPLATNDNWDQDTPVAANAFAGFKTWGFTDGSKDAALLVTLPPGLYSVHANSADGASGVVLIELYTPLD